MAFGYVVLAALGSSLGAALGSVLQHHAAQQETRRGGRGLLRQLLTRPLWLAGTLAAAAGFALHAVALSGGQLALVQPLLVCALLFALPVSILVERRRVGPAEWLWAVVLVGGLTLFLLAAAPVAGRVSIDADTLAVTASATGGLVLVLWLAGRHAPARYRAPLLGTAAGAAYGITAALLKQTTAIFTGGWSAVFADWPLYAVVTAGGIALALTQLAYSAGPLVESLPAITVADPAVSVMIGAIAFQENLDDEPGAIALQVLGFALMLAASVQLAHRASPAGPEPAAQAAGSPGYGA